MGGAGCRHAGEPSLRDALLCLYVSGTDGVAHGEFGALLAGSMRDLAAMAPCQGGCVLEALGVSAGTFESAAECLLARLLVNERATSWHCQEALSAYMQAQPAPPERASVLARMLARIASERATLRADGCLAGFVKERIRELL